MNELPDTIETPRLLLRPHRFEDAADIMVYAVEADWARYMPVPHPYLDSDADEFLAKQTLRDRNRHHSWAIVREETVVGGIDLILDPGDRTASLGYALSPSQWNKGFMTEAVGTVINHAFEGLPELTRIWAWADSRNEASLRVMAKLGMTREGTLRQHKIIRGKFVDAVYCGILRQDWKERAG